MSHHNLVRCIGSASSSSNGDGMGNNTARNSTLLNLSSNQTPAGRIFIKPKPIVSIDHFGKDQCESNFSFYFAFFIYQASYPV